MKIRRILVDLDPKQANQTAIDRALRLAGSCNASIDLFASVNVQWFASDISVDAAIMQQSREEYFAALESWVAELAAPLRAAGVEVSSGCKWAHPRHAAIIKRASEIDADLIIRMAHMHNRLERLFLSATDWELIRHAPQALWLVKETEAQPAVFNLLAAVDPASPDAVHVELDQRLLEAAVALNKSLPGELHIFHAFEPPTAVAALPLAGGAGAAAAPLPRGDVKLIDAVRDMHRSRLD
ncbi:MAG TPA: universal stress protein, partial [Woeseiaceae bacterium]|nr:universal stress protein [Woeseiaceae bacterium]